LLLAVLQGIEAAFWAEAYFWLGAVDSPEVAILYPVDSMSTQGASGLVLQQIGSYGRVGGVQRHDTVRDQHGLHFRGDAGVLAAGHEPP
jgi:hypothetical protein